jgi:hypothetical protein
MTKTTLLGALTLGTAALLAGCGGFTGPKTAIITGSVLDLNSNPVRDADVWTIDDSTVSSTSGVYQLTANRKGEVKVTAEITKDGVRYRGSSWALTFDNEQSQNVNIVVGPVATNGRIVGVVRDRDGNRLENVSVFAYNFTGSAVRDFTDSNGEYELEDVLANVNYEVSATARIYRSDVTNVTLGNSETRTVNLILDDPGTTTFGAPTGLDAVTWVSPTDPTRAPTSGDPYLKIKQRLDPRYKPNGITEALSRQKTRALRDDLIVETDLFWDPFTHPDLLGYSVYRAPGNTSSLSFLDFSADPLGNYYVDIGPNVGSLYSYGITALATLYPDLPGSESDLSNIVVVETLDLLQLQSVTFGPTFRWFSGSGADEYFIFLFDEFPGVEVDWIWDNLDDPAFGTSYTYTGPSLVPGRTYYYLVLGQANGGASRTISQIGSFQA